MSDIYNTGTRLLVQLKEGEAYEGNFCSGDDYHFILSDVAEYPSRIHQHSTYKFYKLEIESISILEDKSHSTTENSSEKIEEQLPVITIHKEQYENIKKFAQKYLYISVTDKRFLDALNHIKSCDMIAIFGLGSNFGRCAKISLLTVSTKSQVYIFDIKMLGQRAFEMGLTDILQSDEVLKIIHDCKALSDCLEHSHKTTLAYVFDTQVADFVICKNQNESPNKMRKFSECINLYLNIPVAVIEKLEVSCKQLLERPLSDIMKLNISLQTSYLLCLKKIVEKKLLENYNRAVNCYLHCMRDAEAVTARRLIDNAVPDVLKDLYNLKL